MFVCIPYICSINSIYIYSRSPNTYVTWKRLVKRRVHNLSDLKYISIYSIKNAFIIGTKRYMEENRYFKENQNKR